MDANSTYRVLYSAIKPDYDQATAMLAFAQMANISVDKATQVLSSERVLKKQLQLKVAYSYKNKLEAIGLDVKLQPEPSVKPALTLSLEPLEEGERERFGAADLSHDNSPAAVVNPAEASINASEFTCPKCGLRQQVAAQCSGCGVYRHKVEKPSSVEKLVSKASPEQRDDVEPADPKMIAVAAAFGVALLSAYLWKLVAVITEYELGIVAWGIGGAIGISAIALGSVGIRTGVLCGALALCAIIGGKYLIADVYVAEASQDASQYFQQLTDFSTWDLVRESISPRDFLFLFLGVATAFRMGATGRVS
jgi:hypothetical protein